MNVLAISYGKNFFDPNNDERTRQQACAKEIGTLHSVVFTNKTDNLSPTQVDEYFYLYPTSSQNSWQKIRDAIRIGIALIQDSKTEDWVITAQDPFEAGLVAWQISRATGVPFNIQEHGDFFSTKHWRSESLLNVCRSIIGKYILKKADSIRVVSKRIKNTLVGLGVHSNKIDILSVRTDRTQFKNAVPDTQCIPHFDSHKKYILTVARFVPQKNLFLLLHAFKDVHIQHPEAHLLIVGQGKQEQQLKACAEKLLSPKSYTFMQWSDTVPTLMATTHLYTLSSNYEGWGRVLIEAQAAGVPIVTTDVGCVGEAVSPGIACQVVPVGDTQAFTAAMTEMLAHWSEAKAEAVRIKASLVSDVVSNEAYAIVWANTLRKTVTTKV